MHRLWALRNDMPMESNYTQAKAHDRTACYSKSFTMAYLRLANKRGKIDPLSLSIMVGKSMKDRIKSQNKKD